MSEPQKVEEVYAFIIVRDDGAEYVPMVVMPQYDALGPMMLPHGAGHETRINFLRSMVPGMAKQCGHKIKLLRFTYREQLEEWAP